ncbi:hypothetical protein BDK51DRAFT_31872 [Blyttiomyces helicus]|uniref:Uncharacterized protein n=1 Tax=Blyttiomyces helicus TaxID=388810 RepID=A0A4V1IQD7_9FUNG|nr:hypothetical protein BDK51DRAFT_31872 [Blyttiomyces helicus]|eukprot:RKO86197.1 hypothetical protein BDK51DRAFT_31872 [Blyttiomyces helicus]
MSAARKQTFFLVCLALLSAGADAAPSSQYHDWRPYETDIGTYGNPYRNSRAPSGFETAEHYRARPAPEYFPPTERYRPNEHYSPPGYFAPGEPLGPDYPPGERYSHSEVNFLPPSLCLFPSMAPFRLAFGPCC